MTPFILDASVALAWYVDYPAPPYAVLVRQNIEAGRQAIAPALWVLEMANGLSMAERRGKLTVAAVEHGLSQLELLMSSMIEVHPGILSVRETLAGARSFRLTAYDATYLELARRMGLQLATLDNELRAAMAKAGVALLQ